MQRYDVQSAKNRYGREIKRHTLLWVSGETAADKFSTRMGADGENSFWAGIAADKYARAIRAANKLAVESPERSAQFVLGEKQKRVFLQMTACLGVSGLLFPGLLLLTFSAAIFILICLSLFWRGCLCLIGLAAKAPYSELSSKQTYPVYTILIALYDEAAIAEQLAASLAALDYPRDKLDVKLLLEEGDIETVKVVEAQAWPTHTEILILPPGLPRTKPRALNYGLESASGNYIVVYDAEDRPHPSQLKAALSAFQAAPRRLACVQAPLIGVHRKGRWLAAQWALEYSFQFGCILPGLSRLGLPVLLGGTSNHFRRAALEDAGGWDAWNVTEDADLGLRLAQAGYQTGYISPPTYERPPDHLDIWTAQRSRWLKGFMQTWLILMRHPIRAIGEMGFAGFASTQLLLGGSILFALLHGFWLFWCLLCMLVPGLQLGPIGWSLLGVSYGLSAILLLAAPGQSGLTRLGLVVTAPLYWPLQSLAAVRALYGLCKSPHFWAKTPHIAEANTLCPTGSSQSACWPYASASDSMPIGRPENLMTISDQTGFHG